MKYGRKDSRQTVSIIELNKLIAYKGAIGREREKWCKRFISWKSETFQNISVEQKKHETTTGNHVTCSKGCSFCCSQYVSAGVQECDAIVYWLYQHGDVLETFLLRYNDWWNRICEHEDVFQQAAVSSTELDNDPLNIQKQNLFMEKGAAFDLLDIPCPFLDQEACSIYPVRPVVCASIAATSPPDWCNQLTDDVPNALMAKGVTLPPYITGEAVAMTYLPVALCVAEIIKGGFAYLAKIPGLKEVSNAALGDPAVRSLIDAVNIQQHA